MLSFYTKNNFSNCLRFIIFCRDLVVFTGVGEQKGCANNSAKTLDSKWDVKQAANNSWPKHKLYFFRWATKGQNNLKQFAEAPLESVKWIRKSEVKRRAGRVHKLSQTNETHRQDSIVQSLRAIFLLKPNKWGAIRWSESA